MKIIVKSIPKHWEREKSGEKSFTSRCLDGKDTIEIVNTETGDTFTRQIIDIVISDFREIIIVFKDLKKK